MAKTFVSFLDEGLTPAFVQLADMDTLADLTPLPTITEWEGGFYYFEFDFADFPGTSRVVYKIDGGNGEFATGDLTSAAQGAGDEAGTDYCSLAEVRAYLRIPDADTSGDAEISRLISAASDMARGVIGRDVLSASYSETQDICDPTFVLDNSPVTDIASVTVGIGDDAETLTEDEDFVWRDNGIVRLLNHRQASDEYPVTVAYTAGLLAVPNDLRQAVIALVAFLRQEGPRLGLLSHNVNGETLSYAVSFLPHTITAVFERYRQ